MIDVASVVGALLIARSLSRSGAAAASRPLNEVDIQRLCVLAFLHDIGKANTGFQVRYWEDSVSRPQPWKVAPCGHGPQGWALFEGGLYGSERVCAGLPLEQMSGWGEATKGLLHASISHHGRPVVADNLPPIWHPIEHRGHLIYDPAETVAAMGAQVQWLYPRAFTNDAEELPDSPAFSHWFAGLVQLADWLGSDTRDAFFPYSTEGEDRSVSAPARATHAVKAVGLDGGHTVSRQAVTTDSFEQAFGVPSPRPIQTAAGLGGLGSIVVIEAETGSGKTEAALWRFLQLWRKGEVDALYFALPTRVAATQLHERVLSFVRNVWAGEAPVVVRALPGYVSADGHTYSPLPSYSVLWHDEPGDAEADRRWAAESPKRFLAATIAVGTVDQALLGALQIKHAHLRQALLSRSLLVIDEVHASDAYMTRLSEHLLRAHTTCGGKALLLSATLGAVARARYLAIGKGRVVDVPSLAESTAQAYPALSQRGPNGPELIGLAGNPRQKSIQWEALDAIEQPERIAGIAIQAARLGARVLVIRNTVPAAVATLKALEAAEQTAEACFLFEVHGVSTLHHSRFSRQDRPLLDAAVQAQVGKHRHASGGRIVVGTQTLEQSLDIDADLLITDLCPMDVLLQRLGRLHRHERPSQQHPADRRPAGFEQARAWVLTPPGHDLRPMLNRQRHGLGPIRVKGQGLSGVYLDLRVLEATLRLVRSGRTRQIPEENRYLVEQTTHPEALNAIARDMGPDWEAFGREVDGVLSASKTMANLHALPFEEPFGDTMFPANGEAMGSRLGAADRLVIFGADAPAGPFGQPVLQLAIRHHMVPRGLALDAEPSRVASLSGEPGFSFQLGDAHYTYTRFGLARVTV